MACGRTDPGLKRPNNEDYFGVVDALGLYLVADGLGGLRDGEVASKLAVESAMEFLQRTLEAASPAAARGTLLRDAVQHANRVVLERSDGRMATTLTALLLDGDQAHVAHVGDCRVYRWRRGGRLHCLTRDHSRFQAKLDDGFYVVTEEGTPPSDGPRHPHAIVMTPAQARRHREQHILERVIGLDADVAIDLTTETRHVDDRYLLCSDGLIRVLSEPEIEEILGNAASAEEQADALVAQARAGGAPDNVTVIVVHESPAARSPR